jgi:hypothetical protein
MAFINFQPKDYFNTKLYSGSGSTTTLTGVGFQPDWTWIKRRNSSINHKIYDAVRTAGKSISSNNTAVEITNDAEGYLSAFTSDGFTVQAGTTSDEYVNQTGGTYVSWNWKANGAGVSNTDGSITSTVSASTTSGMSIVKWTAVSNGTVGHGLGAKPAMVIVKSTDNTSPWLVWHKGLTGGSEEDRYIILNQTSAQASLSDYWGTGGFTNQVFGVNSDTLNNNLGTMIGYCFAEKTGFSKFGSYTGNASTDGSFVYTGFKPAFVMIKVTNGIDNWFIFDNRRSTSGGNVVDDYLYPNLSNAEGGTNILDFLSNGFKLRTTDGGQNGSSNYIFMAFAESPIVSSNGVPTVAR